MEEKIKQLRALLAEIDDLARTQGLLGWDQQTYMPPAGGEDRGNLLSTLARLEHERWTSDEMARLLDDLTPSMAQMDPDSDELALVRVARRQQLKRTRVPARHVSEFAQITTVSHEKWVQARKTLDFSVFLPYLERIIDLRREYASFFAPYDHVYDPLLDDYEPGMKTTEVQAIFNTLRPEQVALIQAIVARPQVNEAFLNQPFEEKAQWDFGVEVITNFGYDWNRGRQDIAAHPFSSGIGHDDVRITTRFDADHSMSSLFSTMHECGHAMYDQGHDPAHRRSLLCDGASMAVHESQSRMWENLVGRSLPFWKFYFPRIKEYFPTQLGAISLETFYKGINRVQPSFIRVESDEATYNLHIMLRMELEIAMVEGSLEAKHLPEKWNTTFKEYLGLTPPNDALGVLQDVHWSAGLMGYFPTYALGNLVSVQLWEKINADIPNLEDQIATGKFDTLLGWLRQNIHRHGAKFEPQKLVQQVTGSKIDPQPYLRYLRSKFGAIYGL
jgi:carboxypeptidase Taq